MRTPNRHQITDLFLDATCAGVSATTWDKLMLGATRANKRLINAAVKAFLPDVYEGLALNLRNPYDYYKTKTHLILVHSGIEYFLDYSI